MKKNITVGIIGILCLTLGLAAQQTTRVLTINAAVSSRFKIEISSNTVTFTRTGDPRTTPVIFQNEAPIQIRVKGVRGFFQRVVLRIQANGNLSDGLGHTIPAGNVNWEATGSGFTAAGTLSGASQQLGRWTDSGEYEGTLAFSFQDDETFTPGVYTLVVTLSVSAN